MLIMGQNDIISRIKSLMDYKRMTATKLAIEAKIDASNFNKMMAGKQKISNTTLSKLSVTYNVNFNWLLTGEGEMLNATSSKHLSDVPEISKTIGVPYYNVDFIGGFDIVLNDQTVNPDYLINFKAYSRATCWCNITGHSMEPEINHGDIIALRRIEDFSFLPLGEIYAIVTRNDMRTVKRLGSSPNPDCYTLIPTNKSPEYGTQEIAKDMIIAIFEVLGCMKRL